MTIERWEIGNSSEIHFTVRHLLLSRVRGRFSRWSGTVLVPDGDWGRATVDVAIDASSIDTGIPQRDTDLRSEHFLDVVRYPVIAFRTLYITARQADAFQVVGRSHQTAGRRRQWERCLGPLRHHDRRAHRHRDRCGCGEATRGRSFVQQ
jgi:hypothetical protein